MGRPCQSSKEGFASSQLHPWAQARKAQLWPREGGIQQGQLLGKKTLSCSFSCDASCLWVAGLRSCWCLFQISMSDGLVYVMPSLRSFSPQDSGLRRNVEHPLLSLGYFDSVEKNLLLKTHWWHGTWSPFFSFISFLLIIALIKIA